MRQSGSNPAAYVAASKQGFYDRIDELLAERDMLREALEEIVRMPYAFGAAKKARDALERLR